MSTFHRIGRAQAKPGLPNEIEGRLSARQAAVVIAGLSALSWAVLISIFVALHTLL